jgi:hypothetical protein
MLLSTSYSTLFHSRENYQYFFLYSKHPKFRPED